MGHVTSHGRRPNFGRRLGKAFSKETMDANAKDMAIYTDKDKWEEHLRNKIKKKISEKQLGTETEYI